MQRIAYRIQGNSCPGTVLPSDIVNDYDNNEAHSSMTGAVMWPLDTGFPSDTSKLFRSVLCVIMSRYPCRLCIDQRIQVSGYFSSQYSVLIYLFDRTYKTWYYGLYINTPRNIIIDSCTTADSGVGILAFKMASSRKLTRKNK